MQNDLKEIIDEIYHKLLMINYQSILFGDLKNFKYTGNNYIASCPFHEDDTPSFSIAGDKPLFHCFGCNKSGDWITYLEMKDKLTFNQALEKLSKEAKVDLPKSYNFDREAHYRKNRFSSLLELSLNYFRRLLFESTASEALEYLHKRGYSDDDIKKMELGYYPDKITLMNYLINKGFSKNEIEKSFKYVYKGDREDYKITIAYRDRLNRLVSIWGRIINPSKTNNKGKYLPFSDSEGVKNNLFNLNKAKGNKNLILVEGYFDALILTARGINNVVALGGTNLNEKHIKQASRNGAKNFILCLDNDKAGLKATNRIIDLLEEKNINSFVMLLPEKYKDPDQLLKEMPNKGLDIFKDAYANSMAGYKWKAYNLLTEYDLTKDIDREILIEKALEFDTKTKSYKARKGEEFIKLIAENLHLDKKSLLEERQHLLDKKKRENLKKDYSNYTREINNLLKQNEIEKVTSYVIDRADEFRIKRTAKNIKPYSLSELDEDILNTKQGLNTGYKELDSKIFIPESSLTIIAGRPSHGKTSVLLNLLINMVELYPDKSFLFFSYEETRKILGLKVLNILSNTIINGMWRQNLYQLEGFIKHNMHKKNYPENSELDIVKNKIIRARDQFDDYTKSDRLWIIDSPFTIDKLIDQIFYINSKYDLEAVFIDYIQKINSKENNKNIIRQIEIQQISEKLRIVATNLNLPVIVGAQLGRDRGKLDKVRLDNLRESGDLEQDASLVIGIYNETMEKKQNREMNEDNSNNANNTDPNIPIELTILKNRNGGGVNESVILDFNRPTLKISDSENVKNWEGKK